jgi:DNA-binding response OmpR family regulator
MKSTHRVQSDGHGLPGVSLLVVEDDFLLLTEMAAVLRDAGAETVHTCRTIGEALALLDHCEVRAAILDVRVGRDSITPVARKLVGQGTPFLFYTGQMSADRRMSEWPDRLVLSKPSPARVVVATLAGLLADGGPASQVDRAREDPSSAGE